jgi:hypothetical protein
MGSCCFKKDNTDNTDKTDKLLNYKCSPVNIYNSPIKERKKPRKLKCKRCKHCKCTYYKYSPYLYCTNECKLTYENKI